jgi:sugar lactone lactonase YvrE
MNSTRGRTIAVVLLVLALLAGGVLAASFWMRKSGGSLLQPGWTAFVHVLAGDGVADFRDGQSSEARFSDPFGVAVARDGGIFVADAGASQRIRRIAPDGSVWTIAGGPPGFQDGAAADAQFNGPSGLAIAIDGTIYVADTGNHAIRRISPEGRVSTIAGGRAFGYRDAAGADAQFNGPIGVAIDPAGRVIVADAYNDRIRAITPDGSVVTLAGSGRRGSMDGPAGEAQFDTPCGVAVDRHGTIYVADTGNNLIRTISAEGFVSTVGPPPPYGLVRPIGIAVDESGVVFLSDERGRVVEVTPGVSARTLAGSRPGFVDGAGEEARFRAPSGLAVAGLGRLVVADSRNALVRIVAAAARLPPTLPVSPRINPQFDPEAFALDGLLWPLLPMEGPFEITGTLGEARGGPGGERFHAGLDVHAQEGTTVVAVRDGIVSSPLSASDFGTLNESVRIGDIAYVHIRVGRVARDEPIDDARFVPDYDDTGKLVGVRVKRGARFAAGDIIGSVNRFNHVHMNVGWPGEEYNPLRFPLAQFRDTTRPSIRRGGIRLFDEAGNAIAQKRKGRLVVAGRVHIVVDAWDQVDGNQRRRRLGLYQLGYQVLSGDGSPAPGYDSPLRMIQFDRLVPDDEAARSVYWSGSGIPFFRGGATRFLYTVSNSLEHGRASQSLWDTGALEPGEYTLRVVAADISGNEVTRDLPVTVVPAVGSSQ